MGIMPAGAKYNLNPIEPTMPEMCRYDTVYRYSGGFNLVRTNLTGIDKVPPMTPIVLDFAKRTATVIINVTVTEKITAGGTSLKIKKGSLIQTGMHLGNGTNGGTVQSVDKSNSAYDLITLKASPTLAAGEGDVLFQAKAATGTEPTATATALNYAWVKVEEGATITAVGQAYEIRPSKLLAPISNKDKETLGDRFMFTL